MQFQLRYCPALAKKPTPKHDPPSAQPKKKFDPFDNPSKDLLIAEVPGNDPSHILVLNKYPIIPNHFILATKSNKQQTHKLEEDDIRLTYECLKAWDTEQEGDEKPGRLFAFFNSGEHSGASQPHRHVQFLPEDDMKGGRAGAGWSLLADQLISEDVRDLELSRASPTQLKLPFVTFATKLNPKSATASPLHETYTRLYEAALDAVKDYVASGTLSAQLHSTETGDLPISYNLAMTTSAMVICPRIREGLTVTRHDGSELDFVALNGTILGGTLMVKNEELWHLLRQDEERLHEVLKVSGIPNLVDDGSKGNL